MRAVKIEYSFFSFPKIFVSKTKHLEKNHIYTFLLKNDLKKFWTWRSLFCLLRNSKYIFLRELNLFKETKSGQLLRIGNKHNDCIINIVRGEFRNEAYFKYKYYQR